MTLHIRKIKASKPKQGVKIRLGIPQQQPRPRAK